MKRYHYIVFLLVALTLGSWLFVPMTYADDFVDDIYYTPEQVLAPDTAKKELKPVYSKRVREIVFISDTASSQNDTVVRAIIRK